jgi:prepilin-type N-terminal cleavage/methylation domain-containing protein
MSCRGFSLIELLIACALLLVVSGAVAALASPVRAVLERAQHGGQLEPAGQAAMETLVAEIREAGSDAGIAEGHLRLSRVLPRVFPMRDLDSSDMAVPAGAVRLTRTPHVAAQGLLAADAAAGAVTLQLATGSRCTTGAPSCGFRAGTAAVLYQEAGAEVVTLSDTGDGFVTVVAPLVVGFAKDAVLSEVVRTTYGLRRGADGSGQLVRLTTGGAEQPMLDNVVEFEVVPNSDDPLRVESVQIRLRIEAASAALRGPAGYLFRRRGTAANPRLWLPDVELRITVALRNPSGVV